MININSISKRFRTQKGWNTVLDDISATFNIGENVGILGRNGAGKSTLLRIIGGAELPDSGTVTKTGRISWPLGFSGCFHGALDARANIRFVSRIYDADYKKMFAFIEEFTELGEYLDMPVRTYSSGMRAKLAFGLSMAIGFEWYLIDEITAVGDAAFQKKCREEFEERKKQSNLLVVSHNMGTIRQHCDKVAVLYKSKLHHFDDLDEGAQFYQDINKPLKEKN